MMTTSKYHVEPYLGMDRASPSRMYDYFLGGFHNFAVDRGMAEQVLAVYPDIARVARANRAFLRRAVRFLLDQGIDQFLDIGSGIPTAGNVHDILHERNPAARVVYVDIDPIAVHLSLDLLKDVPTATAIQADAREPEFILAHPDVRHLLDLERPVGVLLLACVPFIADDAEVYTLVRTLRQAVASGSYFVFSHLSYEGAPAESIVQLERLYAGTTNPVTSRSRARLEPLFEDLEVVAPGVVHVPLWHPEGPDDLFLEEPSRSVNLVGVGRKAGEPGR